MSRFDAHRALIAALEDRYGAIEVTASTSRPWASATYSGDRHRLACAGSLSQVKNILATVADADLAMRGRAFVADIIATSADGRSLIIEALTIDEI